MTHAYRRLILAAAATAAIAAVPQRLPAAKAAEGSSEERASDADALFFKAWYLEHGLRDFPAAVPAWEAAVAAARVAKRADLLGRALAGKARSLRASGRADEAVTVVREAREAAPGEPDVVALAGDGGRAADSEEAELAGRIGKLVEALSLFDTQASNARDTLALIGDAAVPPLAANLRSVDPTAVQAAAGALGRIGTPAAWEALRDAASDPKVRYPARLLDLADVWSGGAPFGFHRESLPLVEALYARDGGRHRGTVLEFLCRFGFGERNEPGVVALLGRCLDELPESSSLRILDAPMSDAVEERLRPRLLRFLESKDPSIVSVFSRFAVGSQRERRPDLLRHALGLLDRPGTPAWSVLVSALDNPVAIPDALLDRIAAAALREPGSRARALDRLSRPGAAALEETKAALAAFLASVPGAEPKLVAKVADLLSQRPDLRTPAAVEALRGLLASADPALRAAAHRVATSSALWPAEEADAFVAAMLRDADPAIVLSGLNQLGNVWTRKGPPSECHAAYLSLVADIRDGRRSLPMNSSPFGTLPNLAQSKAVGVTAAFLLDVMEAAQPMHGTALQGGQNALWDAVRSVASREDRVRVASLAEGRLPDQHHRTMWASAALSLQHPFTDAVAAVASPHAFVRFGAYSSLASAGENAPTSLELPHLAGDLRDGKAPGGALNLAMRYAHPGLAGVIRERIAAAEVSQRPYLLRILSACDPAGAVAEVAAALPEVVKAEVGVLARELTTYLDRNAPAEVTAAAVKEALERNPAISADRLLTDTRGGGPPSPGLGKPALTLLLRTVDPSVLRPGTLPMLLAAVDAEHREAVLLRILAAPSAACLAKAAELAGNMNLESAWEPLRRLLNVPDATVAPAARAALESLATARRFRSALEDGSAFGGDALDRAREMLRSTEPAERRTAVLALAALGDRAAVADLLRASRDADAAVRSAAVAALERLAAAPTPEPPPAPGDGK